MMRTSKKSFSRWNSPSRWSLFPTWQQLNYFYMYADLKVTVKVRLYFHAADDFLLSPLCLILLLNDLCIYTFWRRTEHWGYSISRLFCLSTLLIVFFPDGERTSTLRWASVNSRPPSLPLCNQPFAVEHDAWWMSFSALDFSSFPPPVFLFFSPPSLPPTSPLSIC